MDPITRRQAIKTLIMAGGAISGPGRPLLPELYIANRASASLRSQESAMDEDARLLGTIAFTDGSQTPLERVLGRELDGRLYTDLSLLNPDNTATPTDKFYIRTCASRLLPEAASWKLRLRRPEAAALDTDHLRKVVLWKDLLGNDDLKNMKQDCGRHLMECAGNGAFAHFGMLSVARWAGIPLIPLLEKNGMAEPRRRILVSGFDTYGGKSLTSIPGASWVFSLEDLAAARAFLATSMNGAPLTRDHGVPVRLVVPGWYGCCCIKWVNEISAVSEDVAATSQMQEYATRTHQGGVPALAREYSPAVIDPAAMPVRVEKWRVGGKIEYRVIGIAWGASRPRSGLEIQFNPQTPTVSVNRIQPDGEGGWSFWSHTWRPAAPGRYTIRLSMKDRTIRTRRLDMGFYERSVVIAEV
jgi:hypothetical protein